MNQTVLHVQSERRGNLLSRVTSDITTLQEFMEWGGVGMIIASGQVILAMAVMMFYEWRLALIALVGVLIYLVMMRWFQKILARNYDAVREEVGASLGVLSESITAIPIVRAYGTEESTKAKVAVALEKRFQVEYRTARFGNILFSTAEIFAGLLTAVLVITGVVLGVNLGMTAGTLIAFLLLTNLLIEPLQILVETLEFAQSAASGLRRVVDVLDGEIEVADPAHAEQLRPGGLSARFDHVHYRYPEGPEVLSDVTVDIPVGSRIAVVGETGSGQDHVRQAPGPSHRPDHGARSTSVVSRPRRSPSPSCGSGLRSYPRRASSSTTPSPTTSATGVSTPTTPKCGRHSTSWVSGNGFKAYPTGWRPGRASGAATSVPVSVSWWRWCAPGSARQTSWCSTRPPRPSTRPSMSLCVMPSTSSPRAARR